MLQGTARAKRTLYAQLPDLHPLGKSSTGVGMSTRQMTARTSARRRYLHPPCRSSNLNAIHLCRACIPVKRGYSLGGQDAGVPSLIAASRQKEKFQDEGVESFYDYRQGNDTVLVSILEIQGIGLRSTSRAETPRKKRQSLGLNCDALTTRHFPQLIPHRQIHKAGASCFLKPQVLLGLQSAY